MTNRNYYMLELFGDIARDCPQFNRRVYFTVSQALRTVEELFIADNIDIEDDRIVVWLVEVGEPLKLVWHFSGWHYPHYAEDVSPEGKPMSQGTLYPNQPSLYDLLSKDI